MALPVQSHSSCAVSGRVRLWVKVPFPHGSQCVSMAVQPFLWERKRGAPLNRHFITPGEPWV